MGILDTSVEFLELMEGGCAKPLRIKEDKWVWWNDYTNDKIKDKP
jgi:hypothetical protein